MTSPVHSSAAPLARHTSSATRQTLPLPRAVSPGTPETATRPICAAPGLATSPRRTRRAFAAASLLAAFAATSPALAKGSSHLALFTYDVKGSVSIPLDEITVPIGASHGLRAEELSLMLVATPSEHVMVSFLSDALTTEAAVFAEDPSVHAGRVQAAAAAALAGKDPTGNGFLDASRRPSDSLKVNTPFAVSVPYPNQDVLLQQPGQPALDAQVFLDPTKLAGEGNALEGSAALPLGTGSVKALRVYDHGLCSLPVGLAPLYKEMDATLWEGIAQSAAGEGAEVEQVYTGFVTVLDRDAGAPTTALKDGLRMAGRFHFSGSPKLVEVDTTAALSAQLVLKEGHLRAGLDGKVELSDWGAETRVLPALEAALARVGEVADQAQTVNLLAGLPGATDLAVCQADQEDPCAKAAAALGQLVREGAKPVELAYGVSVDADRLEKAITSRDLWSCVPGVDQDGAPTEKSECRMFVPAKRINVYPDEVELVWFDDLSEQDSAALAAWVAGQAPSFEGEPLAGLCAPRPDASQIDFTQREYAVTFSGPQSFTP